MRSRALDSNHDWTFGKGRNDYLLDSKAIVQNIETRLLSFLGDCFFSTDSGLDWWTLLGSKNQLAFQFAVNSAILQTAGVTKIVNSTSSLARNRTITLSYEVETIFTGINSNGTVTANSSFLLTESGDVLVTEDGDGIEGG